MMRESVAALYRVFMHTEYDRYTKYLLADDISGYMGRRVKVYE